MEASIITWESEKNLTEVLHDWKVLYTRVYFGGGGRIWETVVFQAKETEQKSPKQDWDFLFASADLSHILPPPFH